MAIGVTKVEISISAQVRAKRDALAFTQFTALLDFDNTKLLREELAILLSTFPCNKWGGHTDSSRWAYRKKKCGCSPQTPRCIARQSQSPTLPIRRSWPKPAATFSIFKSNSLACGRTNSARGFLTKLAEKSSSPSLTNSTSKRCTNSIWDTTASPSINFCRKSVHDL